VGSERGLERDREIESEIEHPQTEKERREEKQGLGSSSTVAMLFSTSLTRWGENERRKIFHGCRITETEE